MNIKLAKKLFLLFILLCYKAAVCQCTDTTGSWVLRPASISKLIEVHTVKANSNSFDLLANVYTSGQHKTDIWAELSAQNTVLLSKEYSHSDYPVSFSGIKKLSGGSRIVSGFLGLAAGGGQSDFLIACIAGSGNVLWHKRLNIKLSVEPSAAPDTKPALVAEDGVGHIYVLLPVQFGVTGFTRHLSTVLKIRIIDGVTVWQKTYQAPFTSSDEISTGSLDVVNGRLIIAGAFVRLNYPRSSGACLGAGLLLLEADILNGDLRNVRGLCFDTAYKVQVSLPDAPVGFNYANRAYLPSLRYDDTTLSHLVSFGSYVPNSNSTLKYSPSFIRVNVYGGIGKVSISQFRADTGIYAPYLFTGAVLNNEKALLVTGRQFGVGPVRYRAFYREDNQQQREARFDLLSPPLVNELVNFNSVVFLPDSRKIKLLYQAENSRVVLYDADNDLNTIDSCSQQEAVIDHRIADFNYSDAGVNVIAVPGMAIEKPAGTLAAQDFGLIVERNCISISVCNQLTLRPPIQNFCTGVEYVFKALKSSGCKRIVRWHYDTSAIALAQPRDTTLTLIFKKIWNGSIKAVLDGCNIGDSINISVNSPLPPVELGNDTVLCLSAQLRLAPPYAYSAYQWSNGSIDSFIFIDKPGLYVLTVTDKCNVASTDSILIEKPVKSLSINKPGLICVGDSTFLKATPGFNSYSWEPRSYISDISLPNIAAFPKITTVYSLTAIDTYKCEYNETVKVEVVECLNTIFFPNAFSPNYDGLNDTYRPIVNGNLQEYDFSIYNRFGQQVFITKEVNASWNGKQNGQMQPTGAFAWRCHYKFRNGIIKDACGTLLLIR